MKRATAAAMSRLTLWASSIRPVSSRERNPRHQSNVGGVLASLDFPNLYPGGMSRAGLGKSWVRTQPAELASRQSAASHFFKRSDPEFTAAGHPGVIPEKVRLTSALRRIKSRVSRCYDVHQGDGGCRLRGLAVTRSPLRCFLEILLP